MFLYPVPSTGTEYWCAVCMILYYTAVHDIEHASLSADPTGVKNACMRKNPVIDV